MFIFRTSSIDVKLRYAQLYRLNNNIKSRKTDESLHCLYRNLGASIHKSRLLNDVTSDMTS